MEVHLHQNQLKSHQQRLNIYIPDIFPQVKYIGGGMYTTLSINFDGKEEV